MNKRRVFAAGALALVMSLPGGTAEAATLEGSFAGSDPSGDVTLPGIDVTSLDAEWDTDVIRIYVETDGAQAALADPVWSRADPATEGRSLYLGMDFVGGGQAIGTFVIVNGDGAKAYIEVPDPAGQSSGTPMEICEGELDTTITGNDMTVEIPSECFDNPGSIDLQASYGDADAGETDEVPDGWIDDDTSLGGSVDGGYWLTGADGGIFAFGGAPFYGSMGGQRLNRPVVGLSALPGGAGYYQVASDGGIFAFGDARFEGSMGGNALNKPMVGMASTGTGEGYWTVAADGGVFAFGDARFLGSMGGKPLNSPVVGIEATDSGEGYWLFAADGGVFAYGDAVFHGSMGGQPIQGAIAGGAKTNSGNGYRLLGQDAGIFAFGDATFQGNHVNTDASDFPATGIATSRDGYLTVDHEGTVGRFGATYSFGDLNYVGVNSASSIVGITNFVGLP